MKLITTILTIALLFGLAVVRSATAFNYVADANGTYWGIQDAASPGVDTGSPAPKAAATGSSIRCTFPAPTLPPSSRTARFSTWVVPYGTTTATRGRRTRQRPATALMK